jgi:hypothetical protein
MTRAAGPLKGNMKANLRIPLAAVVLGFPLALLCLSGQRDSSSQRTSPNGSRSPPRYGDAEKAPRPVARRPPKGPARAAPGLPPVSSGLFLGDAFEGTFVQLGKEHRTWPASQWHREFENLRRIGIRIVIVQWCQHDDADFTVSEGSRSVIETITEAADEQNMELYVGLSLRSSWGRMDSFTAGYMAEELARNTCLADKLYPRLKAHPSFCGWYIPHEVTDLDLATDHQAMTRSFFRALVMHLRMVDGLKSVLASGYTNPEKTKLVHFVVWWTQFLNEAEIDILLFQDGAGSAGRGQWKKNLPFLEAMALLAADFEQNEFWLVADTFTQTHGQPVDDQPFAAQSADITRMRDQLAALGKFKKRLIAYSYFDYMRPSSGARASQLYDDYRKLLEEVSARNGSGAWPSPISSPPRPDAK